MTANKTPLRVNRVSWKRWRLALYTYPIRLIAVFFLTGLLLVALSRLVKKPAIHACPSSKFLKP